MQADKPGSVSVLQLAGGPYHLSGQAIADLINQSTRHAFYY